MNKTSLFTIKIIATIAFAGVLLCIATDANNKLELVCCAVAALCSYIVFFSKKK